MARHIPKSFGTRAKPRPVTDEGEYPVERPEGFSEAPQPMISYYHIVRSFDDPSAIPIFSPHKPERPEKSEGGIPFTPGRQIGTSSTRMMPSRCVQVCV